MPAAAGGRWPADADQPTAQLLTDLGAPNPCAWVFKRLALGRAGTSRRSDNYADEERVSGNSPGTHRGASEGRSIGDQLVQAGMTWKSYQENLPLPGADGVNYSNGTASNLTDFTKLAPLTSASVVQAYAAKHNPFVYFRNVQEGEDAENSLKNVVGFEGRATCTPI